MNKTYWTIGGNFRPRPHSSVAAAIATGNHWDRTVARCHPGTGAGVDAYIVSQRGDDFEFRGLVCGRKLIGENFSCGDSLIERVREFATQEAAR